MQLDSDFNMLETLTPDPDSKLAKDGRFEDAWMEYALMKQPSQIHCGYLDVVTSNTYNNYEPICKYNKFWIFFHLVVSSVCCTRKIFSFTNN